MNGTSICILTMDRGDTLKQTLDAVLQFSEQPYELIIVDNGSTEPRSLEVLEWIQDRATIIRNETNLGLSIGTNQGLEAGQYDCLIHLDNDCIVRQFSWNQILRRYFNIPKVGLVAPSQQTIAIQQAQYQELRWALGMCWAIRKSLFDDIGGYDPQLYHQNECDMALRVRMAGYHVAGISDFRVIHNSPPPPDVPRLGPEAVDFQGARENIGVVQFLDKYTSYFRGRDWNYGTDPRYLMQHWPPDQNFFWRYALQEGINLNPAPGEVTGDFSERYRALDALSLQQQIDIRGSKYLIFRELRPDTVLGEWDCRGAYAEAREFTIQRWFHFTGELYEGYKWSHNLLRPY